MAVKLKTVADSVSATGFKALVHGPSGCGKTVLCTTTGEPTLLISAEAGLLSIADTDADIQVAEVKSIADIMEVYQLLQQDNDFKSVCLDSLSEIAEVVLLNEKENNKDVRRAYGELMDQMGQMVRAFRDLPYNVLMTCKQERVKDDATGSLLYVPAMPGQKLGQQLPYFFDFVFAYRVEKNPEGELVRVLQTSRDYTHEAKDRSGKLDLYETPDMASIIDKVKR